MRVIEYATPMLTLLPEVQQPRRKQDVTDKLVWTGMALFIYLVCSQVPLVGIRPKYAGDAFYWMRVILASNKGTLMELGVSPLVTASLMLQFLKGSGILGVSSDSPRDRRLLAGVEKLLAITIAFAEAVGYASTGAYGELTPSALILVVGQLVLSSVICMLLDEMLQNGYGFGSAISLFVTTNVCEAVLWKSFSPLTLTTARGVEFEGAATAFFYQLVQDPTNWRAVKEVFYRTHLPNMASIVATMVVFCIVNFVEGFAVSIPLSHRQSGGVYPQKIKLFYTSSMPVVLLSAFVTNMMVMSQTVHHRFAASPIARMFGVWQSVPNRGLVPTGGLVYYLTPPLSLDAALSDTAHLLFYVVSVITLCALFSRAWIEVSSQSPREVAAQWSAAGLEARGHQSTRDRRSLESLAERHVPVAAALGGGLVGVLSVAGDLLGASGSGTGILLAVGYIHTIYEQLEKEKSLPGFLK